MSSTPYLFTFTPLDSFFFGGAISFQDGFYVQSEKFPQPATIMGALRASLLAGNSLLYQFAHKFKRYVPGDKKADANAIAGTTKLNNFEEIDSDFGVINRISPVFIVKLNETGKIEDAFFPAPKDVIQKPDGNFHLIGLEQTDAFSTNCGIDKTFVVKSSYDQKNDKRGNFLGGSEFWTAYLGAAIEGKKEDGSYNEKYIQTDKQLKAGQGGNGQQLSFDALIDLSSTQSPFLSHSGVGIGLENKRVKKGMFYVKNDYTLEKNYAFSVICWLKEPDKAFTKTVVLGGENSLFKLTKTKLEDEENLTTHPVINAYKNGTVCVANKVNSRHKIVAISPLILDKNSSLIKDSRHLISDRILNVRMLNSINLKDKTGKKLDPEQAEKDSPHLKKYLNQYRKIFKSDAYRFIPEGSVFFMDQPADLSCSLTTPEKIGYNFVLHIAHGA